MKTSRNSSGRRCVPKGIVDRGVHRHLRAWLVAVVVAMSGAAAQGAETTADWTNAAGGYWNDDANWSSTFYPDNGNGGVATYEAVIDLAAEADYTVTLNTDIVVEAFTLNSANAIVNHTAGIFEVQTAADLLNGTFQLNGGTIRGGTWNTTGGRLLFGSNGNNRLDDVTVNGVLDLSANGAYVRLENGATFTGTADVTGSYAQMIFNETLALDNATINLQSAYAPSFGVAGTNTLTLGAGVIVRGGSGYIKSDLYTSGTGTIVNQGLISADVAGKTLYVQPDVFTNEGTVEAVNGATLRIGKAGTAWSSTGTIQATESTLTFDGDWDNDGAVTITDSTLNLGGTFSTADIGLGGFTRSGGNVYITGELDNSAAALTLNATTGDWTLNGGRIVGGTVNATDAKLAFSQSGSNRLDGVTVNGVLDLSVYSAYAWLENGATFTGTADVTGGYAQVIFNETTTLDNATVNLQSAYTPSFGVSGTNTLTLGAGVIVRGGPGYIRSDLHTSGTGTIVNQGLISADVAGKTLRVWPDVFTNEGTIEAINGGTLQIDAGAWTSPGTMRVIDSTLNLGGNFAAADLNLATFTRSGGQVNITGNLDCSAAALTLNATTGDWTVDGGRIIGGTVNATDAKLMFSSSGSNRLDAVTVNGFLDLSGYSAYARLENGATFTGTADITGRYAQMIFNETATLDNATVNLEEQYAPSFAVAGTNTLTLGPGAIVRGGPGNIRSDLYAAGTGTIVNQGLISADVAAKTLRVWPDVFTNEGTVEAINGATLQIDAGSWTSPGTMRVIDSTLNLGGSVAAADLNLATFTRSGGQVNITGNLDCSAAALTLNATTGDWTVDGGRIVGGTVNATDAKLMFSSSGSNRLDAVTVNGVLDLSGYSAYARLENGATFTGTADVTGRYAKMIFHETATLDNATVNLEEQYVPSFGVSGTNTLTLGPGATVRGGPGQIRSDLYTTGTGTIVNQGLISADVAGKTLRVWPDVFTNEGTVEAINGATLQIDAGSWTSPGTMRVIDSTLNLGGSVAAADLNLATFTRSGGQVNITGNLDCSAAALTLNATTGDWTVNAGRIVGGTVNAADAKLMFSSSGSNRLDAVTVNGFLDLSGYGAYARLENGATFTGTADVTGQYAKMIFHETATLDNATVNLEGQYVPSFGVSGTNTLTLGPGATVRGGPGQIRSDLYASGTGTIVNQGLISADVAAKTLRVWPDAFANEGTVEAINGATLQIDAGSWTSPGTMRVIDSTLNLGGNVAAADLNLATFTRSGGQVNITGNLDCSAAALTLNATTGDWTVDGGRIIGGTVNATAAKLMFTSNGNNRLDGVTVNGVLDLSVYGAYARLENGATFTGTADVTGQYAKMIFHETATLDNATVNLEGQYVPSFGVSGTNTLTLGPGTTIRGGLGYVKSDLYTSGTGTIVNQGLISADVAGKTLWVHPDVFTNEGTVEAVNGGILNFPTTGEVTNLSDATLAGGTWKASAASSIDFDEGSFDTNAAEIVLSGIGSAFTLTTGNTPLESLLATNAAAGALRVLDGRDYTAAVGSFVNAGDLELGGGTFGAAALDNQAGGEIFGFGTVTPQIQNSGIVRAAGGTLIPAGGILGASGTVQIDGGASMDLSGAPGGSSADYLIHNGDDLNLGANNFTVSVDYTNSNWGLGNSFNHRFNVTGAGLIQADGDVSQGLSGDLTGGGTPTAAMNFGNVHVGSPTTLNYRISNDGTTGPSLRGAIQTSVNGGNITDPRLTGSGVTASNFGPIAPGFDSGDLAVTFNATLAGPLAGQVVHVENNFDNVDTQDIHVSGTAFRLASPTAHAPEPVDFGTLHVGDLPSQLLSITNNVPADGFSEGLNGSIGAATGDATASGAFSLLAPGATDSTSLIVGIDTATAGAKAGTAAITLTSDGTGTSGLGTTALSPQTVNVLADVFRYADPTAHAPEPVDFGTLHVGDLPGQALSITNNVPADGFSEGLNGSIGAATGDATASGAFGLLAPGATDGSSLIVGIDTASAGAKAGTASITLISDGTGTSGLGTTALSPQTVNVLADVFRYADPTAHIPEPVDFGTLHVGDLPVQPLSITNNVPADGFSEGLNGSIGGATGDATASGAFSLLAPGATDGSSLIVGIDTATAGAKVGTAAITLTSDGTGTSGLGTTALPAQIVNVLADVFRYADPTAHVPEPVDFGNLHVGDLPSQLLSITNNVPADGFSEGLNGSIGGATGDATASGAFGLLAPGATDGSSLIVGIDTASAGAKAGTASITLISDGTGTSGLGTTALSPQTVNVLAQVNNYADPLFTKLSGDGSLTQNDPTSYTLDLGAIMTGEADLLAGLGLTNAAGAPADYLAGDWSPDAADFNLSGFDPFSGLGSGAVLAGLLVELDTTLPGEFSGQITLSPLSENDGGFSGPLPDILIALQGVIDPYPGDANLDGRVDVLDLGRLATNYGLSGEWATGDFNGDWFVNVLDLGILATNYGKGVEGGGAAVPEPAALSVLALGACAGLLRRRRRAAPGQ